MAAGLLRTHQVIEHGEYHHCCGSIAGADTAHVAAYFGRLYASRPVRSSMLAYQTEEDSSRQECKFSTATMCLYDGFSGYDVRIEVDLPGTYKLLVVVRHNVQWFDV